MSKQYVSTSQLKTMLAWMFDLDEKQIILSYGDDFKFEIREDDEE